MVKQHKKSVTAKTGEPGFSFSKLIPEKYQTPALLVTILILIFIFFGPVLFGSKTTSSGDLVQVKSLREYATKDRDGFSLWNPYIFCGMPAVATSISLRWFDLTALVYSYASKVYSAFFHDYNAIYTFSFLLMALTSFFFMRSFGAGRGVSFLVSLATIFSTGIVLLFYIGHITKLMSLAVFPFILMMLFRFQKKITLPDLLLFTLGLHVLILAAHVQIVFYFGFASAIYFIYFFIRSFIQKDKRLQVQLLKSLGILAGAGLIALMMSFDTYSQLFEYKPYSTRGTKSITELKETGVDNKNIAYQYNTDYSFSPGELLTFVVPSSFGYGNVTYNGPLTQNQDFQTNTYFGPMTGVDVPMYMGIVVLALGLMAFVIRRRDPFVQFFGIVIVLFILLSFGRNFPVLYNVLYKHLPLFDNFRSPSMILHIVQLVFPVLAGLAVMEIISVKEMKKPSTEKILKYVAIGFASLFVIVLLFNDSIGSWFTQRITDHVAQLDQSQRGQQEAQEFTALSGFMTDMFKNDLLIGFALLALTFSVIYLYISSKINRELFVAGIVLMILFDLFRISGRGATYKESDQNDALFREPEYISVIKKQNDNTPHRLLNLKQDGSMGTFGSNANFNVYFLQEDFSGYSAAKPRSFQDILEVAGYGNPVLWRMLGVKYIITDRALGMPGFTSIYQSKNEFVYRYEGALPRIYFVDSVAQKPQADILFAIKDASFDPKKVAYVDPIDFKADRSDSASTVQITGYKDESISADVFAKGNNFLFYGTTYLPSWHAYIDGSPVKTYRTNYGFQGIVVPKGKHKVEFDYEPRYFNLGKYLSLILNLLLFGALGFIYYTFRKKNTEVKS
jgi:Bacterial membrane protein YfhO